MTNTLRSGTKVYLPDHTIAIAYADRRVGTDWNGLYRTVPVEGGRVTYGWRREQLTAV